MRHRELVAARSASSAPSPLPTDRSDAALPGTPTRPSGAQNLHGGHGATINYIWEFLTGLPDLPSFAFDYWMPLPSVLMSLSLGVHDDLRTALGVSVLMSVLLAVGTYLLARSLSGVFWVPAASAVLVTVQPVVSTYSVQSEASLYLGAFAVLALAAAVRARTRSWLVAGRRRARGPANLSRNEVCCWCRCSCRGRSAGRDGDAVAGMPAPAVAAYLAVMPRCS